MDKQVNVYLKRQAAAKIALEFTGRWRVVNEDHNIRLQLECFTLFPHEVVDSFYDREVLVYKPNWLKRMFGHKPLYKSDRVYIKKNKLINNYGYVNNDALVVEEIYTNICGSYHQDEISIQTQTQPV